MTNTSFDQILNLLIKNKIEFILVGGLAAIYHGSSRLTQDVDIVYNRSDENLKNLATFLAPINPYLRGAPKDLPFVFDFYSLKAGLNFTLITDLGSLDLLGEVAGGGSYCDLLPFSEKVGLGDLSFDCIGLKKLIALKQAVGRAKDLEAIAELELLEKE